MQLLLLGGPGAGKGTQALRLAKRYAIPQISTGDMLRSAIAKGGKLGLDVKKIMEAGGLVSDDIIIDLVKERLKNPDCSKGFLFDGFPRTLVQAQALRGAGIRLDHVIEIVVNDDEIIKRISGRRIHQPSGRVYHIHNQPPERSGVDDITGEKLIQREDDKEETVRKRLHIYHQQTAPLIRYYHDWSMEDRKTAPKFHSISGIGTVEQIFNNICTILDSCENQNGD